MTGTGDRAGSTGPGHPRGERDPGRPRCPASSTRSPTSTAGSSWADPGSPDLATRRAPRRVASFSRQPLVPARPLPDNRRASPPPEPADAASLPARIPPRSPSRRSPPAPRPPSPTRRTTSSTSAPTTPSSSTASRCATGPSCSPSSTSRRTTSKTYPMLLTRTPYGVGPYGPDQYADAAAARRRTSGKARLRLRPPGRARADEVGGRRSSTARRTTAKKPTPADVDESSDAYDTIDWLLKNVPGHNGKVGMCRHLVPRLLRSAAA